MIVYKVWNITMKEDKAFKSHSWKTRTLFIHLYNMCGLCVLMVHKRIEITHSSLSEMTRDVLMLDVNDESVVFERPFYQARVSEAAPRGHFISKVSAYDPDIMDSLRFAIVGQSHHQTAFEIDEKSVEALLFCFDSWRPFLFSLQHGEGKLAWVCFKAHNYSTILGKALAESGISDINVFANAFAHEPCLVSKAVNIRQYY
ncbi:Protocadherin Fat 1 [Orchesella cincta]|uniref:Protocadherin Fat 1 n=1 Tax=Orchesella cincta TaxID=48709 RepID=A0A1D2MTU8_ORCCI|nr:Protocadherin Fat 1 [Orchesella cincta]